MEFLLNLAWAGVAVCLVCLWVHSGPSRGKDWPRQIIAIAVLIAILFPVISVSDDLMAMQNATETDSWQRKDGAVPAPIHPVVPFAAFLAAYQLLDTASPSHFISIERSSAPAVDHPDRDNVENRPPPAA